MSKPLDLKGMQFGLLTVLEPAEKTNVKTKWLCVCECGTVKSVQTGDLRSGRTKTCGCEKTKRIGLLKLKHGHARAGNFSPEYTCWAHIITRCENKKAHAFELYGGRGIKVCQRWRDSFENFFADMGKRPSKGHSVDRIDCNGDYTPENCRWATQHEQTRNTRRNVMVTIDGVTKCQIDWAKELGIVDSTMRRRVARGKYEVKKQYG